jgi:hypothetical protein
MKLRIYDWRFRDRRLEAHYVEDPEPAGVALREDLSPEARRARELAGGSRLLQQPALFREAVPVLLPRG